MKSQQILFLITEISDRGGIEVFSRDLMLLAPVSSQDRLTVLLLNGICSDLQQISSKFRCINHQPSNRQVRKLKFAFEFVKQVLLDRPDFVIANHVNLSRLCLFAYWLLGIPYGVVAYGIDVWHLTGLKKQALKNAKVIAAFSSFTATKIKEQLRQCGEIVFFPPCVQENRFYPAEKSASLVERYNLSGCRVILTVARLSSAEAYKGYDQVIRALPIVVKKIPNVRYLIVGGGDDLRRIKKLAQELGVSNHVVFTGFIPNHLMVDYYNLCDIFLMPSKGEGFGIVFLEALACGKPVIAGNKDGSKDALLDGRLGVLVDPDNVDEIAQAILNVLNGEVTPLLMNANYLRQTVLENFGQNPFCQRTTNLLARFR